MYMNDTSVHGSVVSKGASESSRSIDFEDDVWEGRRENRMRRQARKSAAAKIEDKTVKFQAPAGFATTNSGIRLPGLLNKGVQMTDKVLGTGESGEVYEGIMVKTGMKVAIKTEPANAEKKKLQHEKEVLSQLRGTPGIPKLIWFGVDDNSFVLVLELCGSNVRSLLDYCGGRLSMKTVLNLTDKLLIILESLHKQGIIHRDLCPENVCMGRGLMANEVYLMDLGLAEQYTEMMTGVHRLSDAKSENGDEELISRNCNFASSKVYKGECAASRRDDLESLGYLMIYMLRGELPWITLWKSAKDTPKYRNLAESQFVQGMKMKTKPEALTQGLPDIFCQFMKDVKKLGYDEKPNYEVFRKNFRTQYAQMKLSHDYRWDWVVKQDKEDMKSRAGMSGGAAVFSHKSSFSRGINSSLGGLMEAVSVSSPAKKERRNSKNSISSELAGGETPSHTRALLQMLTGGQQQQKPAAADQVP